MADAAVDTPLRRTPLDEVHEQAGAKLVPFAGWRMPLQYEGIIAEHQAVRTSAGLFDVSHMGQLIVTGERRIAALQSHVSNDLSKLEIGDAQYSMLLNERGGIEDDLIVYRVFDEELMLVVNASNSDHDARVLDGIAENHSDGWAMLALQGPVALDVLAEVADVDVRDKSPFQFVWTEMPGVSKCIVAMTGYTGERGCEILVANHFAKAAWDRLVSDERVTPCGLGARDTLRLEACYPLHGNDIGPDRDPIGAGLAFAAPRDVPGGGPAHEALRAIRDAGPRQKLVPVAVTGRGIPRAGTTVLVGDTAVGTVTSGTMSPILRLGIALAWIDADHAVTGTELALDIRGTRVDATVAPRPFVRGSLM